MWSGREASTLRWREGKPRPKERTSPKRGPGRRKRAWRGLGPLAFLVSREEAPQTAGSLPGSEGEAAASATAGAPAAGQPWRRQGVQLGLLWALEGLPGKPGASAGGSGEVVLGCSALPWGPWLWTEAFRGGPHTFNSTLFSYPSTFRFLTECPVFSFLDPSAALNGPEGWRPGLE